MKKKLIAVGAVLATCLATAAAFAADASEPKITAGLCVVIPAGSAEDLIARTQQGRVLVHTLVADAAQAQTLRAEIEKRGATGLVTVMVWKDFPKLPYANQLVNQVIVDRDAFPGGPSDEEINRVLVPKWGVAEVRGKGTTSRVTKPLPANYGEWTHFYHDATNNPVSRDKGGIAQGIQWITGAQVEGDSHSYVGGGKLVDVIKSERGARRTRVVTRDAFNGLPLWSQSFGDTKRVTGARYEATTVAGDRLIRLKTSDGPLAAYALADGKELLTYEMPITRNTNSTFIAATVNGAVNAMTVVHDNVLYAVSGQQAGAMDVQTGKLKWLWKAKDGEFLGYPCVDASSGTLAICAGSKGMGASRITAMPASRVVGLDLQKGEERWSTENPIKDYIALMSSYNGSFYLQTAAHLGSDLVSVLSLSGKDGRIQWKQLERDMPGVGTMMIYPDRLFVVRSSFHAFDLATGNPLGSWSVGNSRCDVPRGDANFINNFGHFFDVSKKNEVHWDRRELTRNSCGGASIPAYGLRFSSDNRCSCYEAIRGRVSQTDVAPPEATPDAERLLEGPAFKRPLGKDVAGWASFLGNDRRTGVAGPIARDAIAKRWQVPIATLPTDGPIAAEWREGDNWNGPITAPTVSDGRIYVGETIGQRMVCVDAKNGQVLWRFPVEGRIDGPPRIVNGRVVFGSRDGYVYCLDAKDGALAWRFQAARARRLITAYGQLESSWPLRGSLPVVDGTVIAPAGYHPEADGGIALWGLDLATGAVRWKRTLTIDRPTIELELKEEKSQPVARNTFQQLFAANRLINTVAAADDGVVLLSGRGFKAADGTDVPRTDARFRLIPTWNSFSSPHRRAADLNLGGPGGWGGAWGLVDSKLFAYVDGKQTGKPGLIGRPICVTADKIVLQGYATSNGNLGPLYCFPKSAAADSGPPLWIVKDNLRGPRDVEIAANSMVVAGERIIATGTRTGKTRWGTPGPLEIRSLAEGKLLHQQEMEVPSVDHGIAVDEQKVFISLMDGTLLCLE